MVHVPTLKEKIIVEKMINQSLEKIWNVKETKKLSLIVVVLKIRLRVIMNKMLWLFVMEKKEMQLECLRN